MALRDTTWVYDTTNPDTGSQPIKFSNAIEVSEDGASRNISTTGGSSFGRQDETTVYEWICLSKSAADAAMAELKDTSNWTSTRTLSKQETNRVLQSYSITMTERVFGLWA